MTNENKYVEHGQAYESFNKLVCGFNGSVSLVFFFDGMKNDIVVVTHERHIALPPILFVPKNNSSSQFLGFFGSKILSRQKKTFSKFRDEEGR